MTLAQSWRVARGDEGVTLFYDVVRARTAAKQGFGSLAAA